MDPDQQDRTDPSAQPDQTAPDPITFTGATPAQVTALFQELLGRAPNDQQEVNNWTYGIGVRGIDAVRSALAGTTEAKNYAARPQAQKPNPEPNPDPGPAPAPAPAPTAGPAPGPTAAPTPVAGSPAPTYDPPPAYTPPPAFNYADFVAPTGDDVLKDPGYGFELGQGMQAIGAKNAALGTLNTGGTIKDFQSFGQNLASTKYNDIYNRDLNTYQTNRGNALNTYNTNYGTQYKDPYQINYQSQYSDPFQFGMQSAGLQQNNNQFGASLGQNNNQFNTSLDWQKFLQNYKATVTDPFSQKYSLLGLL